MIVMNRLFSLLLCLLVLWVGCERKSDQAAAPEKNVTRFVTLAPAMSQILIDMQQQKNIVGIAQYDFTDAKNLPVVGNYLDIHTEKLLTLNPTHVLMMTGKAGVPPTLQQLADQYGFNLLAYSYPDTLADIQMIVKKIGDQVNLTEQALLANQKMQRQLDVLKKQTADLPSLKILAAIGTDPIMASGPKTVNDEIIRLLGCVNVAQDSPVQAPVFDREKIIKLQPDVILLLSPGSASLASGMADARLQEFKDLPIPAVKNNRIVLINDPLTFLPATTIPRIAKQFAHAIYPQLAKPTANAK